jgi:hypothetical protein
VKRLILAEVSSQVVPRRGSFGTEFTEFGQAADQFIDLAQPVKRVASPGRRKVSMLCEASGSIAKGVARLLPPRSAPEDASYAIGRIGERVLEPAIECAVHEVARSVFRRNLKKWINPCLDRTLAQQIAAESVDRANARELKLRRSLRQPRGSLGGYVWCVAGPFYLCTQPQLHFTGGFFGERDRDDVLEGAYTLADECDYPAYQRGRLPSSGRCLDEQRRVEIIQNSTSCLRIGQVIPRDGHIMSRNLRRGSSWAFDLRRVRR